jgi:pimeloyl-ACP methyl ester carboxylesterase
MEAASLNYDNRSVSVGSANLGYRVEGEGTRKILLLHGLNSHSGTWRKNISALARDATVVAPSLPPNKGKITPELAGLYADQVSAICADAGVEGAAVVGNSMGGWVAMRLLSLHRELVSRVVLEDAAGSESADDVRALETAKVPVLIVWGRLDELIPVSSGQELHSRLPGSELRIIPDAGHVPHWETPEEFNGIVGAFLRRG